jgi:hypothetical protein
VLRGGRYDELVGRYGRSARATGFAVDIEAIAQAQAAGGVEPPVRPARVLVAGGSERRREAARVAAALRAAGAAAAVDPAAPGRRRCSPMRAVGFTPCSPRRRAAWYDVRWRPGAQPCRLRLRRQSSSPRSLCAAPVRPRAGAR